MKKKLLETPLKKLSLFSFILLFSGIALFGQDVQFPRAVISSGGGNFSSNAVNLTRWRIGQINVVTIPSDENIAEQADNVATAISERPVEEWSVTVYPNPVNTLLKVHFDMEIMGKFTIEIYDLSGRKLIAENALNVLPGQVAEIDLRGLSSALYFLKVIPIVKGSQKVFKIFKQ